MTRHGLVLLAVLCCACVNGETVTSPAPRSPATPAPATPTVSTAAVLMRYDLERIDGVLVPAVLASNGNWLATTDAGSSAVLRGGRYLFRADGTVAFGYLFGTDSFDSTRVAGTYAIGDDGVIRFSLGAYNAVTATISGDRLLVKYQDSVDFWDEVYVRKP